MAAGLGSSDSTDPSEANGFGAQPSGKATSLGPTALTEKSDRYAQGGVDLPLFSGAGTTIAVLDTGLGTAGNFQEIVSDNFGGNIVGDEDFTDSLPSEGRALDDANFDGPYFANVEGHGTAVAYIAAGRADNLEPEPEMQIMPVKVCDSLGVCHAQDIVQGVCHALLHAPESDDSERPAKNLVINISFSGPERSQKLYDVLEYALDLGAAVVVSIGNGGADGDATPVYPAAYASSEFGSPNGGGAYLEELIVVGAVKERTDGTFERWSNSNHAGYVDFAAVGVRKPSLQSTGAHSRFTGTSFAVPQVALMVALLRSAYPDEPLSSLIDRLKRFTRPQIACPSCTTRDVGDGVIVPSYERPRYASLGTRNGPF